MEVKKLKVQKLEVQEPELSVLGAGGGFRGVLRCPRVAEKAKVTLPSWEVREREAFPSTPSTDELIHCLLHKVLSSCHLGRPG